MRINKQIWVVFVLSVFMIGAGTGLIVQQYSFTNDFVVADDLNLDEQEATIRAINKVNPAVVSIQAWDQETITVVDVDTGAVTTETEKVNLGNGSGFIITPDGLIVTNRHVVEVVSPTTGEYKVILKIGQEYYAQLISKDPIKDIAIIKIFDKDLPFVEIGDSNILTIGSTVIALGNSLSKYPNSASKGIVSGLGRFLSTNQFNIPQAQNLDNVIQTDAGINLGNSGGPLIDLQGRVVGVNVAIDEGGNSIGFALPMIDVIGAIRSVKESGLIIRPRLGVRYQTLTDYLAEKNNLPVAVGAWLDTDGDEVAAVLPDSPAARGGLEPGDIITEVNAIPVNDKDTLFSVVGRFKPGDRIGLRIYRGEEIIVKEVVLDSFEEE